MKNKNKYKNIFTDKESIGGQKIKKLASKPLNFKFPQEGKEYLKFTVKNKLIIFFYPEKIFPTVRVYGYIKAGEIFDTKEQVSKLTALMLRDSDTENMNASKINDILDFDGSQLDFIPGMDFVKIQGKYLVENEENFIKILSYFLSGAKFSRNKFKILKDRVKSEERRNDDIPFILCRKLFYKIIYGKHPYGYFYTAKGVDYVSLGDIEDFYKKFYTPKRIVLIFCGDVHSNRVISYLKKFLSNGFWNRKEIKVKIPEVEVKNKPGVFICDKPNVTQSAIYFGKLIKTRDLKSLYGISLFNHILGGSSFASKYTQQVRDVDGIAYRVDSKFYTELLTGYLFLSRCRTKVDLTYRAIAEMLWIQDGFINKRITQHEFLVGKSGLSRGFIKNFNTVDNILNMIVKTKLYGRKIDYLKNFSRGVEKLTYDDLVNAAKSVVSPKDYSFVLVGGLKKYEKKLKKFGKIYEIDEMGNVKSKK